MKDIALIPTDRQLLLYDIFKGSEQMAYEDITSRLPTGRKMVQRDIKILTDAGLIRIKYSKKDKAYIFIIYSKWAGYLEGKHADPKVKESIGNHRMEKLHTSGHAYVETIEKMGRLTNPKVIIPMHTECTESFGRMPTFAAHQDRVKVLQDKEEYGF